jgi:hypothetical protein
MKYVLAECGEGVLTLIPFTEEEYLALWQGVDVEVVETLLKLDQLNES